MKTTVDIYDMKAKFVALDRDYYTYDGLEALLDYYDYGYKYPAEEWLEDNDESKLDNDLYIKSLVKRLEDETTVLHLPNGNYIVFAF